MSAPGTETRRTGSSGSTGPAHDDDAAPLLPADRMRLVALASRSIDHGLVTGTGLPVDPRNQPKTLRRRRACFVSLRRTAGPRGCVGEVEASRSLAESVADRAFRAAFRDTRFDALRAEELHDLEIHVALVTAVRPLAFDSERELCRQLQPGVDGVTLRCGPAGATFLPGAWTPLPDPHALVAALKDRAGLSQGAPAAALHVAAFRVCAFSGAYRPGPAKGN